MAKDFYEIEGDYDDYYHFNPILGLSDAIVGTYGPTSGRGQSEQIGRDDYDRGAGFTGPGVRQVDPKDKVSIGIGCCCAAGGPGTGSLIDESEMVL